MNNMNNMNSVDTKNNPNSLNKLLFNPDSFFREKSKDKVNLKYPILLVLASSVFTTGSGFLTMNKLREFFSSEMDFMNPSLSVTEISFGVVGGLIVAFLYWVILTGILYSISYLFDSKGSFKRTLEFVGYGFVPQIFSSFVNFIVMYKLLPSVDFSSQGSQFIMPNINQILSNNPLFYTSQIIGILCLLLSAYIWMFALLHARTMSIKNAVLTVCIPTGLYIIYQVYMFLFAFR